MTGKPGLGLPGRDSASGRLLRDIAHQSVSTAVMALVLAVFPAEALDESLPLSQCALQVWQVGNGLPQNTVSAILQTRDGYLWVGTEGGLARFDGFRFALFDSENTPALKSNNIRALVEDGEETLWIATSEGVARLAKGEFRSFTVENGLASNDVRSLALNDSGTVIALTASGDSSFGNGRFRPVARGLRELGPQRRSDSARRLWSASEQGLSVSDHGLTKLVTIRNGLPSNRITALLPDREGSVWVGTDAGAVRIANGRVERFPSNEVLSRELILSIFEDREGNVWFGTDSSGLVMVHKAVFTTFGREATGDRVRCVVQDRRGNIWIGTNGEGLRKFDGEHFSSVTAADGLSSNVVLSLAVDRNDDLWVGTPDGLNRLHRGKISVITSSDGLAEDFIRSVYSDPDGSVWVGTRHGLSRIRDRSIRSYDQSDGLGSDVIGALVRGSQDELWIATLHGLTKFKTGTFRNYNIADGLTAEIVTELYRDSEGILWIGTQGGGLCYLDKGVIHRVGHRSKLPDTIYGITDDRTGKLWLAAKTGVFSVSKADLLASDAPLGGQVRVESFGPADGLRVSEFDGGGHPAIWRDSKGAIWFATAKGVAVQSGNSSVVNRLPIPVVLESVSVDDKAYRPFEKAVIDPDHTRLAFEYAGIHFGEPQKVHYHYKLEGFDKDWINAGTRRSAFYTNLPPGHMRFRVIASSNETAWNENGASFSFYLRPHFYQTWWFDVFLSVLAAACIYAVYEWRVRQVQARYNAILGERNRIAREIHDTLAQGFVAVSVQLEIVSRLLDSSAEAVKTHLDQARSLVKTSLADARQAIWELRSQAPEQGDFAARLAKAAKQAAGSSSAKIQLRVHGTYRPLKPKIESELFRIGQEAVTNAARHSGAENIAINLAFDAKLLRMTVSDDGCGFQAGPQTSVPNGHFGLQGMRERAIQIGAQFYVQSEMAKGTSIVVEVPAD